LNLFDPTEPVPVLAAVEETKTVLPTKRYMSWSRISMYLRCGEQFRRVYVMGHRAPPSISLICGSSTHAGAEANYRHRLSHGKLLPTEEVVSIARSKAAEIVDKQGISLTGDDLDGTGTSDSKVREHVQSRSEVFTRLHCGSVAPHVRPKLVEHVFRLVTQGFPFDLVGVLDLQEEPSEHDPIGAIRDIKTSGRFDSAMAEKSDQLTLYGLWGRQSFGVIPPLMLDLLVATKEPKAYALTTKRTDADISVLERRIEVVASGLEKGVFLPAPSDSWCCSEKFCGFFTTCPYARKVRSALFSAKPDPITKTVLPDEGKVIPEEKVGKEPKQKKPAKGKGKGAVK
jgi:hypothetical protein